MTTRRSYPIVADQQFVQATRDTGYRSTALAIAELVDNALEAGARRINIHVQDEGTRGITVAVVDDGAGMDSATLRAALQFGGSSRFDQRNGLGRFGMGLPNSSASQARRVEVFTWRFRATVTYSYLDLDEVIGGIQHEVPRAKRRKVPRHLRSLCAQSGTIVVWRRCDRLDSKRVSTLVTRISRVLGRIFRHYLWDGVQIRVNGQSLRGLDPLFLHRRSLVRGAQLYGRPLKYEVRVPGQPSKTSTIAVRFSLLPVLAWRDLSGPEKRTMGLVGGAGVSVLRAGREIDCGWYFMGAKRKENYDDWWRCEVSFEPDLDELFGVTHSKQQITPSGALDALLSADLESVARTLNRGVREAFAHADQHARSPAEKLASARDALLAPLGRGRAVPQTQLNGSDVASRRSRVAGLTYVLSVKPLRDPSFYVCSIRRTGVLALTINSKHPFFEHVYRPSSQGSMRFPVECLLLAAGRAEAEAKNRQQRFWYERKRVAWSNALAAFLT